MEANLYVKLTTSGCGSTDCFAALNSAKLVGASLGTATTTCDARQHGQTCGTGLEGRHGGRDLDSNPNWFSVERCTPMTSVQRAPVRPNRMAVQARLMRVINAPMRLILGLPFATPFSRQLMLLHLTGRKSGKRYVQPVSYVPDGNTLLTPGGGRWKLNLKPSECVRPRLRGRDVLARPELIRDVDQVELLLRKMQSVNPRITSFVPVGGSSGEIDHARLQSAINYGFALVRWHFDCPPRAV
jgi:hypothetical protein